MVVDPDRCTKAALLQEELAFLGTASHYPDRSARVSVRETHYSWIFLTEHYAYKLKKPSRHASMDYRRLASRARGCRDELRLNRRLAPTVYVDVVPLSRNRNGKLALGRGRSAVDWLVKMRRLPASRLLDHAIARGALPAADIRAVAGVLTDFFRRARRRPMTGAAYCARLRTRTTHNAHDLRAADLGLNRARVDAVIRAQREFIRRGAGVLAARGARLVDGHGDLRAEHVCLGPPACVIDCLEFDPDLRRLDPVEEFSLLALECARLGRDDLGTAFLQRYRNASQDAFPDALQQFYMSQCAATRAKIAAWHVRDPAYRSRRPWITRANSCLTEALHHARVALRMLERGAPSVLRRDRPAAQQRGKRSVRQHAPNGRTK